MKVEFQERSVKCLCLYKYQSDRRQPPLQTSLNVRLPTGSDVVFDLDPLAHAVDTQASSYRVLTPKIEVKLVKKDKGVKWGKIEGEDETAGGTMGECCAQRFPAACFATVFFD